jgi:hypothetical protein
MPGDTITEWQAYGLACRITMGFCAPNGYVQIPSRLFSPGTAARVLSAAGGVTYGPDADGWVGFHTAHGGDYWAPDDLVPYLDGIELQTANDLRRLAAGASFGRRWTVEALRKEVEQLAQQIAVALDLATPADGPAAPFGDVAEDNG